MQNLGNMHSKILQYIIKKFRRKFLETFFCIEKRETLMSQTISLRSNDWGKNLSEIKKALDATRVCKNARRPPLNLRSTNATVICQFYKRKTWPRHLLRYLFHASSLHFPTHGFLRALNYMDIYTNVVLFLKHFLFSCLCYFKLYMNSSSL